MWSANEIMILDCRLYDQEAKYTQNVISFVEFFHRNFDNSEMILQFQQALLKNELKQKKKHKHIDNYDWKQHWK